MAKQPRLERGILFARRRGSETPPYISEDLRRNAQLFHGILGGGGLSRRRTPLAFARMNPLLRLFAVAVLFTASLSHAASFEGKVTLAMTTGKNQQVLDYSIKGTAIRIDMAAQGQSFATIMDLQKMEMLMLMSEQKMYMVMPIKDKVEKAVDESLAKQPNIEKTGRTETILGYKCDEYLSKDGNVTTEIWIAEGLGAFMGLGSSGGMGDMFGGSKKKAAAGWEEKFKGKPGFPLRVISRDAKSKETFKMEATKIEPGTLSPALFQAPAGWQKFQMPNMGGMLQGLGQ
jgi:hypothetical protein